MVRILGRVSSINVRKVLWTCDEIGLAYEREDYGTGFAAVNTPEFLALNPNGQIPVLIDEVGPLWESNTICRYLATKHARTDLLPADPRRRAGVEMWIDWQATELNASWVYAFMALYRRNPAFQDKTAIAAGVAGWNRTMAVLEDRIAHTGAYAAGDTFTLADIVLGLSLHRWRGTEMDKPEFPALDAYYHRLRQRPAFPPYSSAATV